ncbi:MAG: hypothetical protein ACRDRU_08090 [Pseudonocardiaceae bacterium]
MDRIIRGASALLPLTISTYPPELNIGHPDPVTLSVTLGKNIPTTEKVNCDRLTVRLRIGEGALAWTSNREALASGVQGGEEPGHGDGWTPENGYSDGHWQVFEFVPNTIAVFNGTWHLTLKIYNIELNDAHGWAEFQVTEKTSKNGQTTEKTTNTQVQKAPNEFVFHSFHPEHPMIGNGDQAKLEWQGTQTATYTVFWDNNEEELQFGPNKPFGEWLSPELHKATSFMLQARYAKDGKTFERILTTTVEVANPDLTVKNLTVLDTLTAKKDVTITGTLTSNGKLTATGDTVRIRDLRGPYGEWLTINSSTEFLPGNKVLVNGGLEIKGTLTATGDTVRIRDLRGPSGERLTINSSMEFLPDNTILMQNVRVGNTELRILSYLTKGELVVEPFNTYYREHLYAAIYKYNDNRRYVFTWGSGGPINNGYWILKYPRSASSLSSEDSSVEGDSEPEVPIP